jgi:hypothetical protein
VGDVQIPLERGVDLRQPVAHRLVDVDHESIVDIIPGLDDLQLWLGVGQSLQHLDLEQ